MGHWHHHTHLLPDYAARSGLWESEKCKQELQRENLVNEQEKLLA
jgi:hypothetical protein